MSAVFLFTRRVPRSTTFKRGLLQQLSTQSQSHRELARTNPALFWKEQSETLHWHRAPSLENTLDTSNIAFTKWFTDGSLNITVNCLDRWVEAGRGQQNAIIFDSPVTNVTRYVTYKELKEEVELFSHVLRKQGVKMGDRVLIYMPNSVEAVVAMLSCVRLGAIHSVVFGGFSAVELASRIRDCTPKVVCASSCGIDGAKIIAYKPLVDDAIKLVASQDGKPSSVEKCIILQRAQLAAPLLDGRDLDWAEQRENAKRDLTEASSAVESFPSTHPLYILYTSGTTGSPKGVVRDSGGYATALLYSMNYIYNVKPGDVFWAASDVGWVVGHSYKVYGPLLQGCTTVIFEGKPVGTPDEKAFWRILDKHRVNVLFTAPTAIRAIKRLDSEGKSTDGFSFPHLKSVFLAGERSDIATVQWAEKTLQVPIVDHWWQTESGWPICSAMLGDKSNSEQGVKIKHGSASQAVPGYNLEVLDDNHNQVDAGTVGTLAIKLPLPPGFMLGLYNAPKRYLDAYMTSIPGYYDTADAGYQDSDGFVFVTSRVDDVINCAGHRLSVTSIEDAIALHRDVAEVVVVGVEDSFKGQVPLGLVVLNAGSNQSEEEVVDELKKLVRERVGPVASFNKCTIVKRLPRTRSGKILRGVLRKIANKSPYKYPSTIEDDSVLKEVEEIIRSHEC